ncbi:hypothetical protein GCM10022393_41640 [Aquimarina addita]|uniref:Uncharacterized protein n=1 Tax=Aquimarina addita TaxID=870485 RepID=A0ABP6UUB4_9FLAO
MKMDESNDALGNQLLKIIKDTQGDYKVLSRSKKVLAFTKKVLPKNTKNFFYSDSLN